MSATPQLRRDLTVVEQTYRGEQSYIVKDPETRKYFRFKPLEMLVMQEFDGRRTCPEVARVLHEQGIPLTSAKVEGFARKLMHMGLMVRTLAERSVLMMERLRVERHRRVKRTHYQGSVLRMRWSVGDPDKFFDRVLPHIRFLFTPAFVKTSVVLFGVYFLLFLTKWPAVSEFLAVMSTPSTYTVLTVMAFWTTFMFLVIIHELAHGFTCKYFGGQVYEMGAMLFYFQPAFYCNVNDSWTFPELRKRIWVTAAGSWIELALASVAGVVWLMLEPNSLPWIVAGLVFVFGGVSTIVANANPLIPFDGYYALSDYLEIPNLRHRAFGYLSWLVKRHILRLETPDPEVDERERRILITYGVLASVYILSVFFFVGGLVYGWVSRGLGAIGTIAFVLLLWALLRDSLRTGLRAVATSVREHRTSLTSPKLWKVAGVGSAATILLGVLVPWPVTVPGFFRAAPVAQAYVTAPEDGLIDQIYVREGSRVTAGEPIIQMRHYDLERAALSVARLVDQLTVEANEARVLGRASLASRLETERNAQAARLASLEQRLRSLTLRAPFDGVVATPRIEELASIGAEAGDTLVHIIASDTLEIRIALDRAGASLVEPGNTVKLVSYSDIGHPVTAQVTSVSTAASETSGQTQIEARVRLAAALVQLRPGGTGEAKVIVRHSNIFGALWWNIRKRLKGDLLL